MVPPNYRMQVAAGGLEGSGFARQALARRA
jgi:hypothetical protein